MLRFESGESKGHELSATLFDILRIRRKRRVAEGRYRVRRQRQTRREEAAGAGEVERVLGNVEVAFGARDRAHRYAL